MRAFDVVALVLLAAGAAAFVGLALATLELMAILVLVIGSLCR